MSVRSSCSTAAAIAAALMFRAILSPAPLAAQQDSSMMSHDSSMMSHGDSSMGMSHDSGMMDHGKAMEHDKMMDRDKMGGANMMFMGGEGQTAAGDYEVTETAGKHQLKLTEDFSVAAAPDLYLVLTKGATPGSDGLYIGKLKKTTGAQTFDLPKGKDLSSYSTLLVWSKKEKRAVASAEWHAMSGKMMDHM